MPVIDAIINAGSTFIGPSADGAADDVLVTDGSGNLSFASRPKQSDLDVIRANLALLGFQIAIQDGVSLQQMIDGIVDEFEDQSGVDGTASTNETYNSSGDYYTNAGSSGNVTPTLDADSTAWANYSIRQVVAASQISADGSSVRVSFKASSAGGGLTVDSAYIAEQAASGDAWDYKAGTKAELLFSASSGFSISQGQTAVSDETTFTVDQTKTYVIGFDIGSSTSNDDMRAKISQTGYTGYYKASANDAGTDNVSGYSTGNNNYAVSNIEVIADPVDMTLISESFTAESTPTDALIVILEEDVDSVTVNTDIKAWASRDNGTTYTQITLVDEGDFDSGKRILTASADISGQPSGTSMLWKITTHNSKGQRIHGVALQWR